MIGRVQFAEPLCPPIYYLELITTKKGNRIREDRPVLTGKLKFFCLKFSDVPKTKIKYSRPELEGGGKYWFEMDGHNYEELRTDEQIDNTVDSTVKRQVED